MCVEGGSKRILGDQHRVYGNAAPAESWSHTAGSRKRKLKVHLDAIAALLATFGLFAEKGKKNQELSLSRQECRTIKLKR